MAGFGYECVLDGKLNSRGKADDKDDTKSNSNSSQVTSNSSDVRNVRSVIDENALLKDSNWNTLQDWNQQWDSLLNDNELETLQREKRRGGRGGGGGRGGRGGRARGGRGGGGGGYAAGNGKPVPPCASNYVALIVVGCIFVVAYVGEVIIIFICFEDFYMIFLIIACVIECIVYFIFMGVMFHISTYDHEDDRKQPALITFVISSILYCLRTIIVLITSSFALIRMKV